MRDKTASHSKSGESFVAKECLFVEKGRGKGRKLRLTFEGITMTATVFRAGVGALLALVITLLAKSKNYYLAGLVPLFPTFTLIAQYMVGTERSEEDLKVTVLFSIFSLGPYCLYFLSLLFFIGRFRLSVALGAATATWFVSAIVLIYFWRHTHSI